MLTTTEFSLLAIPLPRGGWRNRLIPGLPDIPGTKARLCAELLPTPGARRHEVVGFTNLPHCAMPPTVFISSGLNVRTFLK